MRLNTFRVRMSFVVYWDNRFRVFKGYDEVMTFPAPKPKNRVLYEWRGWGWKFYARLKQGKPKTIVSIHMEKK
jgi:hypothetical protein